MRILVFDVPASEGGALSILKDFIFYADNNISNHEWYFVVSCNNLSVKSSNIHIIRDSFPKKSWLHRIFWEIFIAHRIVKQIEPDVILSFQNTAIMFTKVPQVVYIHQSLPFYKEGRWSYFSLSEAKYALYRDLFRYLIAQATKKACKVIVQTNWMKKSLIASYHIPNGKIDIIPPSVNILQMKTNINNHVRYTNGSFFYPASPALYKNFEVIVQAVRKLVNQGYNPRAYLTISGNENRYATKIKRMTINLKSNFSFLGRISREEVFHFYQKSVLVFPSYMESFTLPLLEARCLNVPIIASNRAFAREILEGYSKVDFFDPFSSDELASKMEKYLKHSDLADVSNSAYKGKSIDDLSKYSPDNTWGKIVKLIESCAKQKQ